jgi:hypothetical protein
LGRRRLGALEAKLGDAELCQLSFGQDPNDLVVVGVGDVHPLPACGIEEELKAEIVIRGVELEEHFRDVERHLRCTVLQGGDHFLAGFLRHRFRGSWGLVAAWQEQENRQERRPRESSIQSHCSLGV